MPLAGSTRVIRGMTKKDVVRDREDCFQKFKKKILSMASTYSGNCSRIEMKCKLIIVSERLLFFEFTMEAKGNVLVGECIDRIELLLKKKDKKLVAICFGKHMCFSSNKKSLELIIEQDIDMIFSSYQIGPKSWFYLFLF